ncbi:MAG: NUDIX domain-containing protein, partial [Ginsengibacter sp.]
KRIGMFNVRVYGIYINEPCQVLVSDEYIRGKYYTKFPGGGLEHGEGTRDCLKREFMEEMDLKIEVEQHIYTTDFYQQSAFNPADQIISIYYAIKPMEPIKFKLVHKPFDFTPAQLEIYKKNNSIETFRFIDKTVFSSEMLTFPIDKIVADIIVEKFL